jgi:hypothetical protein
MTFFIVLFTIVLQNTVAEDIYVDIGSDVSIGAKIAELRSTTPHGPFYISSSAKYTYEEKIELLSNDELNLLATGSDVQVSYSPGGSELADWAPVFLVDNSKLNATKFEFLIKMLPHDHDEDTPPADFTPYAFITIYGGSVLLNDVLFVPQQVEYQGNLMFVHVIAPIISILEASEDIIADVTITRSNFTNLEFHETSFISIADIANILIQNSNYSAEEILTERRAKRLLKSTDSLGHDEHDHDHEGEAAWFIYMDEEADGCKINVTIKDTTIGTIPHYDPSIDVEVMCIKGNSRTESVCVFNNVTINAFTLRAGESEEHGETFFHLQNLNVSLNNVKIIGTYINPAETEPEVQICWSDAIFLLQNCEVDAKTGVLFKDIQSGIYGIKDETVLSISENQYDNVTQLATQFHSARKGLFCENSKVIYTSLSAENASSLWISDNNCTVKVTNNESFEVKSYLAVPTLTSVFINETYLVYEGKNLVPGACEFRVIDSTSNNNIISNVDEALVYGSSNETHIVFDKTKIKFEVPTDASGLSGWQGRVGYTLSGGGSCAEPPITVTYTLNTDAKEITTTPSSKGYIIHGNLKMLLSVIVGMILIMVM